MTVRDRMLALLSEADLSPEEKKERDSVAKQYPKNPFIYQSRMAPIDFTIGFATASKKSPEPLWWTGTGFKNLATNRGEPESFKTKAEAEKKIHSEILSFIRKYRMDQTHLIVGW
jgi:hypothetical protein